VIKTRKRGETQVMIIEEETEAVETVSGWSGQLQKLCLTCSVKLSQGRAEGKGENKKESESLR
jgi:hypothetical protein